MTLDIEEKIARIRLVRTEGIGPITYNDLLRLFKTARVAVGRVPDIARAGGKKHYDVCSKEIAEKEIYDTEQFGAKIVFSSEESYPKLLKQVSDRPPFLSICGKIDNSKKIVAIVGARNASLNAQKFCYKVSKELAEKGVLICSGMARGIDTSAHEGAINSTVSVVAGGIDVVYPPENQKLYDTILASGVLISGSPFGMQPKAGLFPKRNMIIAGMSHATVVAEAAIKSGSLITARAALDYGREVFAVPGFPEDPRCRGSNGLIKKGATLLESAQDVLDSFTLFEFNDSEDGGYDKHIEIASDADMEVVRKKILEMLSFTPILIDDLVAACDNNVSGVLMAIIELELSGKIFRLSGQRVCLCADGDL